MIRGAYKSGSHLTFRIIETQSKMDKKESPKITDKDINCANDRALLLREMNDEHAVLNRLVKIREENWYFGRYAFRYVMVQAPNEAVAKGFALGVLTTYSAYEQAYARTKK